MTQDLFEQLLAEVKQGKETIFNRFFTDCYTSFMPQLIGMTKSEDAAKDAFMDAMYKLWKMLVQGDMPYRANLKGYVFVMVKNEWLQVKRRQKKMPMAHTLEDSDVEQFFIKAMNLDDVESYNPLIASETATEMEQQKQAKIQAIVTAFAQLGKKCQRLIRDTTVYKVKLSLLQKELGYASYNATKVAKHQCKMALIKKYTALMNPQAK